MGRCTLAFCFHQNNIRSSDELGDLKNFDKAVIRLRTSGYSEYLPFGFLGRAAFRRSIGDWEGAARDLDEVEEIALPGPMRVFLCDIALERARLALARSEAFAPLSWLPDHGLPKPEMPDADEVAQLKAEAARNLADSRRLIDSCGYRRREEELVELEAVLTDLRRFADLPPRV